MGGRCGDQDQGRGIKGKAARAVDHYRDVVWSSADNLPSPDHDDLDPWDIQF